MIGELVCVIESLQQIKVLLSASLVTCLVATSGFWLFNSSVVLLIWIGWSRYSLACSFRCLSVVIVVRIVAERKPLKCD